MLKLFLFSIICQGWQVSTQHGNYPGNYRVITDTVEILSTLPFLGRNGRNSKCPKICKSIIKMSIAHIYLYNP